uniref:Uncharacterized protein n=1 Tax=Anguilla anguilla TaxID=7936 RepID=A0A0E9V5W0_ANGAN
MILAHSTARGTHIFSLCPNPLILV